MFNKVFIKFTLGFVFILAISFFIIVVTNNWDNDEIKDDQIATGA